MGSCPETDSLVRFLANHLSGRDRTLIETHVENCISCQDRLNRLILSAPGPAPTQIVSALSDMPGPSATSEAEEFIQALKLKLQNDGNEGSTPATPAAGEFDSYPEVAGYEILEELGRGTSGVVFRARHRELDRLVALKMIFTGSRMSADARQRLRVEAQAMARLRHANIVQVYDVNEYADHPYLSLELVEGENLGQWKEGDARPAIESVRLVAILADAIAYAHSQGVIHRDLKPANVLLGTKNNALTCSLAEHASANGSIEHEVKITDFGLARVLPGPGIAEARITQSGMILGTPAYLAPEQAQGKTREIGPAADIYALGAILYELLTDRPPFLGDSAMQVLLSVAHERPVPPTRLVPRLPRELDTICLKCLEKDPGKRYTTARELAADLWRFSRDEPILARPAGRAERGVRWMRRRPAMTALLAGNLLLATILAFAGLSQIGDRAATLRTVENDLQEVARLRKAAAWNEADVALEQAEFQLGNRGPVQLRQRLRQARTDLDQAKRDARLAARLDTIRLSRATIVAMGNGRGVTAAEVRCRSSRADRRYEEAFREAGFGDLRDVEHIAVGWVARSDARGKILTGLDDWACCTPDENRRILLLSIARLANPGAWRDRARDPSTWHDAQTLAELERTARVDEEPVSLMSALGERLQATGLDAISFFQRARTAHRDGFWANFALGNLLCRTMPEDAAKYYQIALTIRPNSSAVYNNLGCGSYNAGRWHEAIGYFQKALAFDDAFGPTYNNLGLALRETGPQNEARACFLKAVQVDQESASAYFNLANMEAACGRAIEAIDHYQHAIRLDPDFALAHFLLGIALLSRAELEQAIDDHERADRLDPKNKRAHGILDGLAFNVAHDRYKQARAFDPNWSPGHFELSAPKGNDLLDESVRQYQYATRLDPDFAEAHGALGQALLAQGRLDEAQAATRRSLDLLHQSDVLRKNLTSQSQRCERLLFLNERLPGILKEKYIPANKAELLEAANLCDIKKQYVSAASLYREMVAATAGSAESLGSQVRHNAARAAILAGSGRGDESAALAQSQRTLWLEQSRIWLRAELADLISRFNSGSIPERAEVREILVKFYIEPELAWLRHRDTTANLSPAGRNELSAMWTDLDELFSRSLDIRKARK